MTFYCFLVSESHYAVQIRRVTFVAAAALLVAVLCQGELPTMFGRIIDVDTAGDANHLKLTSLRFLSKFIATLVSVVQPLPVGLFTPVFVLGGQLGEIYGS